MSYFIGNGVTMIGGGSLGKTERVPSLKLRCLDLCARHLERLGDLGDMPTEMFIDLLSRAKDKATPDVVRRLQEENQRLLCPEVDSKFWKQAVEGHILRRMIPAPGPVLLERVNEHKEELGRLRETEETQRSGKWAQEVIMGLRALEGIPPAIGLLQKTMVGRVVASFRKCGRSEVVSVAQGLIQRWKESARIKGRIDGRKGGQREKPEGAPAAKESPAPTGRRDTPGGAAGRGRPNRVGEKQRNEEDEENGRGAEREKELAEESKQRSFEDGFKCDSWHALYWHLEIMREAKVRASSKRAREARELELQKKPKVIMGKSRGEDVGVRRSSARGFFSSRSSPAAKKPQKDDITSISELKRTVVLGQRLSKTVDNGKRSGGGQQASRPSAKRTRFFK